MEPLQAPAPISSTGASAKILYGFLIPLVLFVSLQLGLLTATSGTGGFEGIGVVLVGVVATLALLVLNTWLLLVRWRKNRSLGLAGLVLPGVIGLVESLWTVGQAPVRGLINATIVSPFLWIWVFVGFLFVPLITSAAHASRRRSERTSVE